MAVDRRRKLQGWRTFWSLNCPKGTLKAAILAVLCALVLMFDVSRLAAQGCATCYQDTAASGAAGRAALRHGILVLLLPAISLFLGMLALIYRRRGATR